MTPLAFSFTQNQLEILLSDDVLDVVVAEAGKTGEEVRLQIQHRCAVASANPTAGKAVVKIDDYAGLLVSALRQTGHDDIASQLAKWHGIT